MELKVNEITALEPIKFNYEELKKEVTEGMSKYVNMIYTEETMKIAKADKANLNKLSKALNDEKIRVKKDILKPYEDFEQKILEIKSIVDKAVINIDTQIKAHESKVKEEKRKEIEKFFNENVGKYEKLILFNTIFNERWLNATTTMKSIQDEITHIFAKAETDIQVLNAQLKDENVIKQTIDFYFSNIANPSVLSLSLQEGLRIIENNKKIEELKQIEEQRKQNIEEGKKAVPEVYKAMNNDKLQSEELLTIDFRVTANKAQFQLLKELLVKNNIKYGKVPEKALEDKELVLDYSEEIDEYEGCRYQGLSSENEKIYFCVNNLCECPEDAIIGRDLFDADDYVKALELGMELARKGYTKIKINEIKESEE